MYTERVRIASALLALLLTLPMTGWVLLPGFHLGSVLSAQPTPDACARTCTKMPGMQGMACPMMKQASRDQACTCRVSGVPHTLALDPVHAVPPQSPSDFLVYGLVTARVFDFTASSPIAGFPGSIDHPPILSF